MNGIEYMAIVRKYARAFCRVYHDSYSWPEIRAMRSLRAELMSREHLFFYLKLSLLEESVKVDSLAQIAQKWDVQDLCQPLLDLLARHKRLFLFPDVLEKISDISMQERGIVFVTIVSSHELQKEMLKELIGHLETQLEKNVVYEVSVDSRLIAGLKIQTNTHGWEQSIAKTIRYLRARWEQHYEN